MTTILEQAAYLGKGADSKVYLLEDQKRVIKVYNTLVTKSNLNIDGCLKLIKSYATDTIKAAKILESEWLNAPSKIRKINFNANTYTLSMVILPQGETQLFGNQLVSIGQKYIPGDCLTHYIVDRHHPGMLFKLIDVKEDKIQESIYYSQDLINRNLKPSFSIASSNIKPFLNESEKKLTLIVTDLANNLGSNYSIRSSSDFF